MCLCSKGDVLNIEDKKSRFERRKEQKNKKEQKKKERIKNNGTGKFYVYF